MRVKVDEDLPRRVAGFLRDCGYDASSVRDQNMGGASDSHLWEASQSEQRFLVTADKGCADVRAHPSNRDPGRQPPVWFTASGQDRSRQI